MEKLIAFSEFITPDSKLIKSQRGVNTFYVNVSNLTDGVYLYSITNGDIIQTKKMIIKH